MPSRGSVAIANGRSDVLGMKIGTSEAKPIRTEYLGKLTRHGLGDVQLLFSHAHAITCLADTILLKQNDELTVQRGRDMTLESIAPLSDNFAVRLASTAA
jgi:hypothetical protein